MKVSGRAEREPLGRGEYNIIHRNKRSAPWPLRCSPQSTTCLKDGTQHQDLGADHFDHRSTEIKAKRLAAQIAKLGFRVELRPLSEAARHRRIALVSYQFPTGLRPTRPA
jgi:hypothetical protein